MTAPRLYLDEDVDPLLARILTQRGFDVLTTQDAGQRSATDADQLAFAARAGRALMLTTSRTSPPLLANMVKAVGCIMASFFRTSFH